jgi:hypothetical protein
LLELLEQALDQRTLGHLFYVCCDELEDIKLATALLLLIDLLKQAPQDVLLLTEQQFQEIFDKFTSSLPKFYKGFQGEKVELPMLSAGKLDPWICSFFNHHSSFAIYNMG